jgi:catechol 2,3-dioxygenase-like lactoylglutathione lyase family enzyme
MKVTRFNHLAVNVEGQDEATLAFYHDLLGMPLLNHIRPIEFQRSIPGNWFGIGDERLHVFDYPVGGRFRAPGLPQPGGPHFAVYADDLEGFEVELNRRGIKFGSNGVGLERQIWILDPGGNTVELGQDPDLSGK